MKDKTAASCICAQISESDIGEAMKSISGYLDITVDDFKEVYEAAFLHAVRRLTENVLVSDVMIVDVISVEAQAPLQDVARTMSMAQVSGAPVIDHNRRVVGVISEKDFLFHMTGEDTTSFMQVISECLAQRQCLAVPIKARVAADIMTSPAVVAAPEDTLHEAANVMAERNINRLPVVDESGHLVGIVSRSDVLRYPINESR